MTRKTALRTHPPISTFAANPITDENLQTIQNAHCLSEHQVAALRAIHGHFTQHCTATVVFPTGADSSAVAVVACYMLRARNVLVVTPAKVIADQLHSDFCGSWDDKNARIDVQHALMVRCGIYSAYNAYAAIPPFVGTQANTTQDLQKQTPLVVAQTLLVVHAQSFADASNHVNLQDLDRNFFDLLIVAEAHHYSSKAWRQIVDHFRSAKVVFLSATPNQELESSICYMLGRADAIHRGILRDTEWREYSDLLASMTAIQQILAQHDEAVGGRYAHKAMVLTREKSDAEDIAGLFVQQGIRASAYCGGTPRQVLSNFSTQPDFRVLVVCGRCLEGFACAYVSIALICRNVAPTTRVMFTQFVGCAVRRVAANDPVTAVVMSLKKYSQSENYIRFCQPVLAEVDPHDTTE